MSVAANAVWEVRASGAGVSDNNGGAWQPLTVSTFSGTDLVVDGVVNTKVSSVSHNFVAADVGTRLLITAGTGWTIGFYTILSVAANAATLNASPAALAATGGTWAEVGADYSQQGAPQVAVGGGVVTSSVTTSVITFTGGTYTPTNADVGNTVQVISGTNTTAGTFLQITATTSTTWTLNANVVSAGTQTNVVANMGGALLTLGKVAAAAAAQPSNKIYCTGAFTTAASIAFAQSSTPASATGWAVRVIGYGAARNDSGHATLTLTANTGITVINMSGIGIWVENLDVDCGSFGTSTAFLVGTHCAIRNCKASNFATKGISVTGGNASCTDCEVTGGLAGALGIDVAGSVSDYIERCFVHDNACPGINLAGNTGCAFNLVANNTAASSDGIRFTGTGNQITNNTCHNNAGDGIKGSGANMLGALVKNNLVTNNGGFGITMTSGSWPSDYAYDGNAYGGGAAANTSGTRNHMNSDITGAGVVNPYLNPKDVTLSASPYVGPTTGTTANFALNNVAGAGAACRGAGAPKTWAGNTGTTGSPDMGAVQSAGKGGAGIIYAV